MIEEEQRSGTLKLVGGNLCLDFANTVDGHASDHPHEWLVEYEDLVAWGRHAGSVGEDMAARLLAMAARHPARAGGVLVKAIALRESVYRLFSSIAAGRPVSSLDLNTLNWTLSDALPHMRVRLTDAGGAWAWKDDQELRLERVLWPMAYAAAELLMSPDLGRVRECPGEGCGWLFIDRSKNRSRRWCAMEDCGNRAKARRHYRRGRDPRRVRVRGG